MRQELVKVAAGEEFRAYDEAVRKGMKVSALQILRRHSIPFYD